MNRFFLIFFIYLFIVNSHSIDLNLPASALQNATNGLILTKIMPSSVIQNPAVIKTGIETSISYLYNLSELPYYNFSSGFRFKKFTISLNSNLLNHQFYKENIASLGVNYQVKNITMGISSRFLYNSVENYHSFSKFVFDAGVLYERGEVSTAFAMKNITQTDFFDTPLPIFFLWESNYKISQASNISIGLEKQQDFYFSFKMATIYTFFDVFSLISSYQYNPERLGAGALIKIKNYEIIYSIRSHKYLSLTHYISFCYAFKK
ncbi:MAG: hypothetical protein K8S23_02095 [Candidatus Cloacimonetes bacterium]|nr:hypothetical protein [Candidatus Cloacimonadota bacterium]